MFLLFFFQAEDGIRVHCVTGVQTCALPILTVAASVRDTVVARNLAYIQGQGTPAVSAPATPVALVGPPTAALGLDLVADVLEVGVGEAIPYTTTVRNPGTLTVTNQIGRASCRERV